MNRPSVLTKVCGPALVGRAPGESRGADAEAAALCAMKLAEAERQARDGRKAVCCG